MLIAATQIIGCSIDGTDDSVGTAKDLYFDGDTWNVRYVIVDTGNWLPGKRVLVAPTDIDEARWGMKQFFVRLTKEQVKNAPHMDDDKPVSRQMERDLAAYYGWQAYWDSGVVMGAPAPVTVKRPPSTIETTEVERDQHQGDPHLRSFKEVKGYHIAATDGDIGHVVDLIIDDERWTVPYLVVDTGNWLPDRRVLLSPQWVQQINWTERNVVASLSQDAIKNSPEFRPHEPVNREYEEQLYDYYGKKKYW